MTWLNDLLLYLLCLALALGLRLWVLCFVRVQGRSMRNTLHDRDWLFVWRLPYRFRAPRRHEVVICHYPGRRLRRLRFLPQNFVKRVIGLPGDTLEVVEGALTINGEEVDEPYLAPEYCRFLQSRPPVTLGPDEYFVMGDNRDHSNDSRRVGPLHRRDIRGHVVCILWPPSRFGRVR